MISEKAGVFHLDTGRTSYWFRRTDFGHLEHIYYGPRLKGQPIEALLAKRTAVTGSSVVYDASQPLYVLDNLCLEWSGIGRGDYRHSPVEARMPDGSFVSDFVYQSHQILPGAAQMEGLPAAYGEDTEAETLELTLRDASNQVSLLLYYTVFSACDVICRRAALVNENRQPLVLRRMMSMMVDLPDRDYRMVTLDGGWIKEAHKHERPVAPGMYVNASSTGASSNRHNPGFLLAERGAGEDAGQVLGINLIYSGNHYGYVERTAYDLIRVGIGLSPHCFEWTLGQGERFETPQAVLSFSAEGYNGLSKNFHDFVNRHIVRGDWKDRERPVLLNNWEAHFFKFNQRKLLRLARQARKLGVETFVLDDGWFGRRNSDTAGLGDYDVNRRKLSFGMRYFAERIRKLGMGFGLWFEPEMVNPDSGLYRTHPDWAVQLPGKFSTLGRNQLVLDLCNPQVRDYIVENVTNLLDDAGITYVKWDMNRHISEFYSPHVASQGEFFHRYILGLYEVLGRIFGPRPHILLETCSSGGNRFDLGMLCYGPQIWASDDTDPVVRQRIQEGLSYLYPLSTMGAHVSESPHQQTLRQTQLSTRFHVASFGCLGYELDLKYLSPVERKEVKRQIEFYKRHRRTFQYGRFVRVPSDKDNQRFWLCREADGGKAIAGFFQGQARTADGHSILRFPGLLREATYRVEAMAQRLFIRRFGGLVKHIMPVELNPNGFLLRFANRHFALDGCRERYEGDGALLAQGILLNNQFMGTNYTPETELLGDYGSYLFVAERKEKEDVG